MSLFERTGVHCVVDGQFGSTGKGALSAWLAHQTLSTGHSAHFHGAIYSGGPNSGHTSYYNDYKIVLKQLPTFSVIMALNGIMVPAYLSAGAIIDPKILKEEAEAYPTLPIFVHPNAAIVTDDDREAEKSGYIAQVAGTRSGTGFALMRKICRDPNAIAAISLGKMPSNVAIGGHDIIRPEKAAYFMEVAQGFSLGINSRFYPKVTSRECTVMQGLADARIPARHLSRTYMAIRTYPIRVGNIDGYSSGSWYSDQRETTWEEIGVTPEITTVTHRIRRVATFSIQQLLEACLANDPDLLYISHMDYLDKKSQMQLLDRISSIRGHMSKKFMLAASYGPKTTDVIQGEAIYAY